MTGLATRAATLRATSSHPLSTDRTFSDDSRRAHGSLEGTDGRTALQGALNGLADSP